jgi:hypothetical protein
MLVLAKKVDGDRSAAGDLRGRKCYLAACFFHCGYGSLDIVHEPIRPDHRLFILS